MLQRSPMYAYIPAKDLARARQFYEQRLGFTPKLETNGGVIYECAGGIIWERDRDRIQKVTVHRASII